MIRKQPVLGILVTAVSITTVLFYKVIGKSFKNTCEKFHVQQTSDIHVKEL